MLVRPSCGLWLRCMESGGGEEMHYSGGGVDYTKSHAGFDITFFFLYLGSMHVFCVIYFNDQT